jgi:hypothetical protein
VMKMVFAFNFFVSSNNSNFSNVCKLLGDCIPESQCPDFGPPDRPILLPECTENEEYSDCGTRCGQGCDELGRRVICPRRRMCISGCFCKEGYFRSELL